MKSNSKNTNRKYMLEYLSFVLNIPYQLLHRPVKNNLSQLIRNKNYPAKQRPLHFYVMTIKSTKATFIINFDKVAYINVNRSLLINKYKQLKI